jgi:AAA15 family ATPase/GTPase
MLKQLTINNFRGFDSLKIDGFSNSYGRMIHKALIQNLDKISGLINFKR